MGVSPEVRWRSCVGCRRWGPPHGPGRGYVGCVDHWTWRQFRSRLKDDISVTHEDREIHYVIFCVCVSFSSTRLLRHVRNAAGSVFAVIKGDLGPAGTLHSYRQAPGAGLPGPDIELSCKQKEMCQGGILENEETIWDNSALTMLSGLLKMADMTPT